MKDIHSHLLYGIDDGSKSIEESIELLKKMKKQGIDELILTPHYIEESKYNCNNKSKEKIFKELSKKAQEEGIEIKLYLGNEAFFATNLLELIKKGEVATLNNSKYILFEFPMKQIYKNTAEIINELVSHGYVPILAHPERYKVFQEHPNMMEDYLRSGVLLQGNFTSLFGKYGKTAEKTLKYFLRKRWVTFLGSDTHHEVKFSAKKLERKLNKITKDKGYTSSLMYDNFDKVIKNEDIGILR